MEGGIYIEPPVECNWEYPLCLLRGYENLAESLWRALGSLQTENLNMARLHLVAFFAFHPFGLYDDAVPVADNARFAKELMRRLDIQLRDWTTQEELARVPYGPHWFEQRVADVDLVVRRRAAQREDFPRAQKSFCEGVLEAENNDLENEELTEARNFFDFME